MDENRPPVVMYFHGVAHPSTPMETIRGLLEGLLLCETKGVDIILPSPFGEGVWLAVCMPFTVFDSLRSEVKNLLMEEGVFKIMRQTGPVELSFDRTSVKPQPFPWVEVEVVPVSSKILEEIEKSKIQV